MQGEVHGQVLSLNTNDFEQDLLCMVAWKDGEPEIKIGFKRHFTKGMQDTRKK